MRHSFEKIRYEHMMMSETLNGRINLIEQGVLAMPEQLQAVVVSRLRPVIFE